MLLKQPGDDEADDCHDVDEDVHRGAGGVFERIADGVANDAGGVGVGSFPSVVAIFNVLLGIVPSTTGIGHEEGKEDTAEEGSDEGAGESFGSGLGSFGTNEIETESHDDGCANSEEGGADHALGGGFGGDVDAAVTVGFHGAFEDARFGGELTTDFLDHTARSFADGVHGEGAIVEGDGTTDEEADEEEAEVIRCREVK